MSQPKTHLLPSAAAARGYRIGSRSRGRGIRAGVKYYVSFRGERISPYFRRPMHAAGWLRDRIAA